jgi:hypothetical protein
VESVFLVLGICGGCRHLDSRLTCEWLPRSQRVRVSPCRSAVRDMDTAPLRDASLEYSYATRVDIRTGRKIVRDILLRI